MVIHHKQVLLLDCGLACSKDLLSEYSIEEIDIEILLKWFSIKSKFYEVDNFSFIQKMIVHLLL